MPPRPPQSFTRFLKQSFGNASTVLRHACPQGGPDVSVYVYRNIPEPGMITGVTYGLSLAGHPEQGPGVRPELMISLESSDSLWAWNAAYFAAEYRGLRAFQHGEVFFVEEPLAGDTKMEGMLVYKTTVIPPESALVKLPQYQICFSQLYPMHRSELLVYERYGLPALWNNEGFDIYDPSRPAVVI